MAASASPATAETTAPPWYPLALLDRPCDPSMFEAGLPSPWGRVHGWDHTAALSPAWWNTAPNGRWGAWPEAVSKVEVVAENRSGVVLHLNEAWVAYLYPFQTGRDVSALARHAPWAQLLSEAPVLLPVAGVTDERGDRVAVFPMHTLSDSERVKRERTAAVRALGVVHALLVPQATPNTERRWNDRLKAIEDGLKTTTLWRAPHTKHVVGLPSVNMALDGFAEVEGTTVVVPQPRPLVDHLLAADERLPGVATVAMLEQRLALEGTFTDIEERAMFYRAWGDTVPPAWTSNASLSTVNGGVWIWRYHATLLMLAEARAYGLDDQARRCDRWLLDVSRIQARLGELRTVHAVRRGGVLACIAGALIGSGSLQIPFIVGAAAVALVAHVVHQRRMPPPF